jgi:hypothetical protein
MWGAIAGMGIGSVMGFMNQSAQNKSTQTQMAWQQYYTDRKREWIADRAAHTGRQQSKSWGRSVLSAHRESISASQRARVVGGARGLGQSGSVALRQSKIKMASSEKQSSIADSFNAAYTSTFKNAEAEDFSVAQNNSNYMMQAAAQMKSPLMAAAETGLSMAGSMSSIQGSMSGGSSGNTTNNYGLNLGGA